MTELGKTEGSARAEVRRVSFAYQIGAVELVRIKKALASAVRGLMLYQKLT